MFPQIFGRPTPQLVRVALSPLLCVLAMLLLAAPAHAAYAGTNGPIAFDMTDGDGYLQVWTINPDGSGRTQLTHASGTLTGQPSFSPDGKKIAYIDDQHLITINTDGSGRTDLTPSDGASVENSDPTWSPDGASIVVSRIDHDDATPQNDLYSIPADGGAPQDLTSTTGSGENESQPAFSPLGDSIAYVRDGNLWTMNSNGTDQTDVGSGGGIGTVTDPAWSADGAQLSVTGNQGGSDSDFWTIADGTTTFYRLTNSSTLAENVSAWAPDDSKLVGSVEVRNSDEPSLYLIDKSTGSATLIANTYLADDPDWGSAVGGNVQPPEPTPVPSLPLLPGRQVVPNALKFTPPTSSAPSPFIPTVVSHKPRVAIDGTACVSINTCTPAAHVQHNTCVQAIGGNADVVVTASCLLKRSQKPENGGWLTTYSSTGSVFVDGVELAPASGSAVTVEMHSGSNAAQSFKFAGKLAYARFESVTFASGNTTMFVLQKSIGGFVTEINGSTNAPVPSGSEFQGLSIAGVILPTFKSGKATMQTTVQLPPQFGGGTGTEPLTLTNGMLATAMASSGNLPLLATGSPGEDASNCETALHSQLPTGPGRLTLEAPPLNLYGVQLDPLVGSGLMLAGPDHFLVRLRATLPYPTDHTDQIGAIVEIFQGHLRFACAAGDLNPGLPLPGIPARLRHIDLGFGSGGGVTVSGHVRISAGPAIPGVQDAAVNANGGVTLHTPASGSDPWTLAIGGDISIAMLDNKYSGSLIYSSDGYLAGTASTSGYMLLGINFGAMSVTGAMDGSGSWRFLGQGDVHWSGISLVKGAVEISNLGVGACGGVAVGYAGLTAKWGGSIHPLSGWGSCEATDLSDVTPALLPTCQQLRFNASLHLPIISTAAASELASGHCVDVPGSAPAPAGSGETAHQAVAAAMAASQFPAGPGNFVGLRVMHPAKTQVFVFRANGGSPQVTLISPDGRTISTAHPGSGTGDARATISDTPSAEEVYVAVRGAKAGAWLARVEPGSAPVTFAGLASQLAKPKFHAKLLRRHGRYTLSYSARGLAKRPIAFFERDKKGREHLLGNTRHARGKIRFTPFDGRAGSRLIIARVGKQPPFADQRITRFRASKRPRLPAPRKLRVRRNGGKMVISFAKLRGAVAYHLSVRTSDGRNVTIDDTKRSLSLPLMQSGKTRVKVSVAGIDGAGRRGRAARLNSGVKVRAPRLKRPRRH